MRIPAAIRRPGGLIAALFATLLIPFTATTAATPELRVLTWPEYMDPDVVSAFQQETGIRIRFVYFETQDLRTRMLSDSQSVAYDVVLIDGLLTDLYARHGWIAPLDPAHLPNLPNVDPRWRDAYPATHEHAVPYFWGVLGIGYRTDLVPEPVTSWRQLFQPHQSLRGRILMRDSNRDLIGMALKALGHSANSIDRDQLRAAEELLRAPKPHVRTYASMQPSATSPLVDGQVVAAMMFNGDAITLQGHNPNIAYVVPDEGGNVWVDYLAVAGRSVHKEQATRFIDYLNRPGVAARNALYVNYATPNRSAERLLPAEYFANPVIYPDMDVMTRSEFYTSLTPGLQRKRNAMVARLVR